MNPRQLLQSLALAMFATAPTLSLLGLLGTASLAYADEQQVGPLPQWIWPTRERAADQHVVMQSSLHVPGAVQQAQLRCAADFCRIRVIINGRTALVIEDYAPWIDEDVTQFLRRGRNLVQLECTSSNGPAAIAFGLRVAMSDGSCKHLLSGPDWKTGKQLQGGKGGQARRQEQVLSFGPVAAKLWGVQAHPVAISPFDDYEQWREALGTAEDAEPASFLIPEDFEIERLRSAREREGSWISLTFDPRGRLVISREDKGLLRMRLSEDGREIESVETINDDLEECRGLLFAHGALYANANNSKGLYRLEDTDGDDQFDDVQVLRTFPGGVGHGRNDLAIDKQGRIYSIHGDAVDVPGQNFLDRTSPYRKVSHGESPGEGHLIRTDRDAQNWELVCSGLRNPFGIAIHPKHQEAFSYDADAEHDMGAPWYRPTRIVHLVSGADYGWRNVTGSWPPYYADHAANALPVASIGKGSPTAVAFAPASSFSSRYRRALFVLDWAYGRVIAVHLIARGASYTARSEVFLRGRPLNVTDLDFGPDGAMYLVTGGRQTQSALYRIRYVGPDSAANQRSEQQVAREKFSRAARRVRRALESYHGRRAPEAVERAWPYLNHSDPALRYAARLALEHQPLSQWQDRTLSEEPAESLTALLALARAADEQLLIKIMERLQGLKLAELVQWQKLTALETYSVCLARQRSASASEPDEREVTVDEAAWRSQLEALLSIPPIKTIGPVGLGGPVQRKAAALLVAVGAPQAVDKTMALLERESSQEGRLHYLFLLRNVRGGWTSQLREAYFAALQQTSDFTGGRGMPDFLEKVREEAVASLSPEERVQWAALLERPPSQEQLTSARSFVREWRLEDLRPALSESGYGRDFERGRRMFHEALCSRCHRVAAEGNYLQGPDLSSVGQRFGREDILKAILDPSAVVAEGFRNAEVITTDGRVLVGRIVTSGDYRASILRLATDPLRPSEVIEIPKSEVEEYRESSLSPMPKGLLDTLTRDEVLDLLAYLESGGDWRHPAFQK